MVKKHFFMLCLSLVMAGWISLIASSSRAEEPQVIESAGPQPMEDYQALNLFSEILHRLRSEYVEEVDDEELIYGAVRGMLKELDPHSVFMPPKVYEDMQAKTRGSFAGLGIEVSVSEDSFIMVIAPIDDTPALRAGIKAQDRIVVICPTEVPEDWKEECRSTHGMTLGEAVGLMRGKKGTDITVHIMRDDFDEPQEFTITRDIIKTASVSSRVLEPGIGYVRISSFQERTGQDLRKALIELEAEEGLLKGLVLDLRDNPGGLLGQAVEVADRWLDEGLVVYTKGRIKREELEYHAESTGTEPFYPMVVLINEGSASASEIVAGALQDHNRALVLGVRSFGKGSVQTVYRMADGSGVKITTALYYTPAGRSIQEVGIDPDIIVEATPMVPLRRKRTRSREKDLPGHFTQQEAMDQNGKKDGESSEEGDEEKRPDPQLARSLEVLKSWKYFDRFQMKPDIQEVTEEDTEEPATEAGVESDKESDDDEQG